MNPNDKIPKKTYLEQLKSFSEAYINNNIISPNINNIEYPKIENIITPNTPKYYYQTYDMFDIPRIKATDLPHAVRVVGLVGIEDGAITNSHCSARTLQPGTECAFHIDFGLKTQQARVAFDVQGLVLTADTTYIIMSTIDRTWNNTRQKLVEANEFMREFMRNYCVWEIVGVLPQLIEAAKIAIEAWVTEKSCQSSQDGQESSI